MVLQKRAAVLLNYFYWYCHRCDNAGVQNKPRILRPIFQVSITAFLLLEQSEQSTLSDNLNYLNQRVCTDKNDMLCLISSPWY